MSEFIKRTRRENIENFLSKLDTEVDVAYHCDADEVNDYDDIYQAVEEAGGFDIDIIYYATAMEYLSKNDPSLQESMALASDLGYEASNINSELLASLLASQQVREDFTDLESEIDDFFIELEEWQETIEEFVELVENEYPDMYDELEDYLDQHYNDGLDSEENFERFQDMFIKEEE